MITTPNLGLKIFNSLLDQYDHSVVGDNWGKVDQHDHANGKGLPITTAALLDGAITQSKLATGVEAIPWDDSVTSFKLSDSSVITSKIQDQAVTLSKLDPAIVSAGWIPDDAITNSKIADGAITTAKLADRAVTAAKVADNTLTADQMASAFAKDNVEPAFSTWKIIHQVNNGLFKDASETPNSGTQVIPLGLHREIHNGYAVAGYAPAIGAFHVNAGDMTASGRTTKYRLRTMISTSTESSPGATITFGLYKIISIAANEYPAIGTVDLVTGSAAQHLNSALTGNSTHHVASSEFTLPSGTNDYCIALSVDVGGWDTVASNFTVYASLEYHQI